MVAARQDNVGMRHLRPELREEVVGKLLAFRRGVAAVEYIPAYHKRVGLLALHRLKQESEELAVLVPPLEAMQHLADMPVSRMNDLYHRTSSSHGLILWHSSRGNT